MAFLSRLRRSVALLAPLIIVGTLAVGAPAAEADLCSGDAITISLPNELVEFSRCPNYSGVGTVTLANNINLADETSPDDFRPIGTLSWPFRGTFDGNGKTISGLNLATPGSNYVGLFGYAGSATEDAVIRNLTLAAPQVTGQYYVGGLFGVLHAGTVENVRVTNAQVAASQFAGGLGGLLRPYRSVVVRDASVQGTATASMSYAGGLLGQVYFQTTGQTATIERVSAVGSAAANGRVGGAIGEVAFEASNSSLTIEDAAVRVGLTRNSGSSSSYFGGVIGTIFDPAAPPAGNAVILTRIYAAGAVPDHGRGGIIGSIDTAASVAATPGTVVWDTQATGATVAATGADAAEVAAISVGRSTAQMKALATFTTSPAWPIVSLWQAAAADRIWGLCASINSGYPFLLREYAITPCAAPQAPTLASATKTGRTSVAVGFTAGAAGDAPINGYEYSLDDGSTWEAANPATTTSPLIVSGLTPGTVYQLRVRAVSDVGTGTLSAALSVTSPACAGMNGRVLEEAGTADDPYLIDSALDLAAIGTGTCALDAHHRQTADIAFPATAPVPGARATNFTPIALTSFSGFLGTYDGDGHLITGLVYDDRRDTPDDNVGLFSAVGGDAVIRDVHLRDVRMRGATYVGGLVGIVDVPGGGGMTTIEDVSVTGVVAGQGKVGGLLGAANVAGSGAELRIAGAEAGADVQVTPTSAPYWAEAGGLVGAVQASGAGQLSIDDARATGDVEGISASAGILAEQVGGLIGSFRVAAGSGSTTDAVVISDALATGAVTTRQVAGGLVGYIRLDTAARAARFERVAATGRVTAGANAGGLIGVAYAFGTGDGTVAQGLLEIVDAYAGGDVVEEGSVGATTFGGLIGAAKINSAASGGSLELERVYARGAVPLDGKGLVGDLTMGRVVPLNPTGFWNGQTTGAPSSGFDNAWTASTTAQMTAISLYANAASPWSIVPLWQAPAAGRTWGICASVNGGYPFLLAEYDAMPCAAPAAPTALVATPGDGTAQIAFTAGAAGDVAITGYETSVDGGVWTAIQGTASPLAVAGLVNGRSHAVRLRAVSAAGAGAASVAVDVTPAAAAVTPAAATSTVTVRIAKAVTLPGGRVQTRIEVVGPGRIAVTGTRVGSGRAKAAPLCSAARAVKKAGIYTLVCALDKKARAALKRAPLRLRLRVVFTPTGGSATATTETVTVPRAKRQ